MTTMTLADVDSAFSDAPTLLATETEATPLLSPEPQIQFRVLAAVVADNEAYFWLPEWQAGEAGATADIESGRVSRFGSADEAIRFLFRRDR